MLLLARRYEEYYDRLPWVRIARRRLRDIKVDAVLANDIDSLPVALTIRGGAPIIFDAHEYSPRQYEDQLSFRMFFQGLYTYQCRKYIPQVEAMMTVCDGIADQYLSDVGIRPAVVWNAPAYEDLEPSRCDETGRRIRIIHHGAAGRSRRAELMIEMMRHLDERFELNLMLINNDPEYLSSLRRLAIGSERIRFLDPVPMPQIARAINQFDIGLYLLAPVNFNQEHALPNKIFEFVQGRLAIAIGPSPEMRRMVERHDLGIVAEDFDPRSLACKLNALSSEEIMRYKRNANEAARALSADGTRHKLLEIVRGVFEPK